jgi:hypothetical protein
MPRFSFLDHNHRVKILIFAVLCLQLLPSCTNDTELTSWQQIGSAVPSIESYGFLDFVINSKGNPVIASSDGRPEIESFSMYLWNEKAWQDLGGDGSSDGLEYGSLSLDSSDNPIVGYCLDPAGGGAYFYRGYWDGTEWQRLQIETFTIYPDCRTPFLILSPSNDIIVAYLDAGLGYVVGFLDGSNLQEIGQPLNEFVVASFLALDNQENPIVAYSEATGDYNSTIFAYPSDIYVRRWTGTDWVQLGDMLDENSVDYAQNPEIAVVTNDNFIVAWNELDDQGSSNVYVKRWNGSTWQLLGGALDTDISNDARYPSLAIDSQGNPLVAFAEKENNVVHVYLKQWDGNSWQILGEPLNSSLEEFQQPQLALDKNDTPLITFEKAGSGDKRELYVLRYTPLVQD